MAKDLSFLMADLQKAVASAAEQLKQDIQDSVRSNAYMSGSPSVYRRTGGVVDYWTIEDQSSGNTACAKISWTDRGHEAYVETAPYDLLALLDTNAAGPIFGEGEWRNRKSFWDPVTEIAEERLLEYLKRALG